MSGPSLLTLLLASTIAAASPNVALLTRPSPGSISEAHLAEIVALVGGELGDAGLNVGIAPDEAARRLRGTSAAGCVKGLECLFRIGSTLGADVVVSLEATEFEGEVAATVEAVIPAEERRIAKKTVVVRASELRSRLAAQLRPFAREAAQGLSPADAPTQPTSAVVRLAPAPAPAPVLPPLSTPPRSAVPAWTAAGGAGLAAVTAVAFGVSGLTLKSEVERRVPGAVDQSRLSWQEATQTSARANAHLTVAIASAIAAAGLGATSFLLWPPAE